MAMYHKVNVRGLVAATQRYQSWHKYFFGHRKLAMPIRLGATLTGNKQKVARTNP
jgi:hypothetical protein